MKRQVIVPSVSPLTRTRQTLLLAHRTFVGTSFIQLPISHPLVLLRAPDPCGEGNVPLTFSHHTYAPSQVRGAYDMREKLGARRVSE